MRKRTLLLSLAALAVCASRAVGQDSTQASASPHQRLGGLACTDCHTTSTWSDVRFDHSRTRYPLVGQHRAVSCTGCHDVRDFTRQAAASCNSCHQDPHRGDAGARCDQCHRETGWLDVNASTAHARTRLPDLGVHAALLCQDCHRRSGAQQFHQPVTPCVGCHQTTFAATTNPSHASIGFSVRCEDCHQLATWQFALYRQHDAVFAIYTGAHAGAWPSCASCHTNAADYSVFTCTTCHTQPRTDPRHQGIPGYTWESTACLTCHPNGSGGAFTNHDAIFPIFSGTHQGQWSACTTCHTNPNDRRVFTCMGGACHPQATIDGTHTGIPGYQYVAAQCLSCHPTGQAGTFAQHDAIFPINSGTHQGQWTACTDCHTNPANKALYTCMGGNCHPQAATDGPHTGIPGYQYVAAQCLACHPTGQQGNFTAHDQLFFPIYSGRHAGTWQTCTTCHPTTGQPAVFTCMSGNCHPQSQTNGNHSGVATYSYTAAACYSCHPRGSGG